MSFSINLFKKDGSKKPFSRFDLKYKLKDFDGDITTSINDDFVTGFTIYCKEDKDYIEFNYKGSEEGGYWTFCSYGVEVDKFNIFKKYVCEIARKLDSLISDDLSGGELINPEDYEKDTERSKKFDLVKNNTNKVIELMSKNPELGRIVESERFVIYFIVSTDPITNKKVYLVPNPKDGCSLSGRIKVGQSISLVLGEDIVDFTGSDSYKVLKIVKNHDGYRNKDNELIPRDAVYVEVPYFNPNQNTTKYSLEWEIV